tara:strand:+ start:2732 stop:3367 length:636 start_codon:yes stop_codon:yes gene_type:complete
MNFRTKSKRYKRRREDILNLRKQGLTYKEIQAELGCSKGTISYHCGTNQREKSKIRSQKKSPLCRKVGAFKARCTRASWRTFSSKIKCFKRRHKGSKGHSTWRVKVSSQYSCADVVEKIGTKPVCYLTGVKINVDEPKKYSLDHRVPVAHGGSNDLENLEICSLQANKAKADLTLDEFYKLCEDVLAWRKKCKKREARRKFFKDINKSKNK